MNKKLLLYIFLCMFMLSCKNSGESDMTAKHMFVISIDNDPININYNTCSDSVRLIPLENSRKSFISTITRLQIDDNVIFIFDSQNQRILKFDLVGNFICQIGTKGRSAREYQFFNDVYIDTESNVIYAFERYKNKMYSYNYDGKLLNTVKSCIAFNSFAKVGANFWVYSCFETSEGDNYNLSCLDESLQQIQGQYFSQDNKFIGATFYPTFNRDSRGDTYFYYPMSDGIYRLRENSVELAYEFDFGNRKKPYDALQNIQDIREYDRVLTENSYLGDLRNLQFYKDYMFVDFKESPIGKPIKQYKFCYNRESGKSGILSYQFDKSPICCINVLGSYNEYLISSLVPSIVFPYRIKELESQYKLFNFNNDSNPVLVLFKIDEKIF